MRMSFKSTLVAVFGSITFITAFTANGENKSQYDDNTFELKDVLTQSVRVSMFVIYTGIAKCLSIVCKEKSKASWKPKN